MMVYSSVPAAYPWLKGEDSGTLLPIWGLCLSNFDLIIALYYSVDIA